MSHTTSSRDNRCPLCPKTYADASDLVHHLAHGHMLHLDRTQSLPRKTQLQLRTWPEHQAHYRSYRRTKNES
jgi:uncharacterized C2H2 Zn-finger protein